jgi:hypothetical protein
LMAVRERRAAAPALAVVAAWDYRYGQCCCVGL